MQVEGSLKCSDPTSYLSHHSLFISSTPVNYLIDVELNSGASSLEISFGDQLVVILEEAYYKFTFLIELRKLLLKMLSRLVTKNIFE